MNEVLMNLGHAHPSLKIALLCVAMLSALVFGLGVNVSLHRLRAAGEGEKPQPGPRSPLTKAIRAHGNATEYVPTLCLLILLLALQGPGPYVTFLFLLATAARYSHAYGMVACETLDGLNPFRFAGATGTYTAGLLMTAALLLRATG